LKQASVVPPGLVWKEMEHYIPFSVLGKYYSTTVVNPSIHLGRK
jgi:hypothetical protein